MRDYVGETTRQTIQFNVKKFISSSRYMKIKVNIKKILFKNESMVFTYFFLYFFVI